MKKMLLSLSLMVAAGLSALQYSKITTVTPLLQEDSEMSSRHVAAQMNNLPHAQGKSFDNLDAYLAHREKMGMQDRPYYREVESGRYKLEIGRGGRGQPAQYFTRQQLMEKYGFSR